MSVPAQSSSVAANNRRIAKNTLALYLRMAFTMGVGLFTSRVVLDALGVVDYGIYNVVGGFVALFGLLSGALSVSISRFFTFELGRGNSERMGKIFSSAILIMAFIGVLVFAVVSTFGMWFLENKLVIPPERLSVAKIILFCSAGTFFIGLISVPYNAAIIAHERMKAFAYVGILEVALKLLAAYSLVVLPFDKLLLYGVFSVATALCVRAVYAVYCKRNFSECRFSPCWDGSLLRSMFSFAGWAFLGNGSFVLKTQGVNIVVNMFCGPAVNAAFGVAAQVTSAVTSFVSNFMQAVNPQIVKNFSSGNLTAMRALVFRSSRFSFFLMLFLCLPVMKSADFILDLWLVDVPAHTAAFIQLTFAFCLIDCLVMPVMFGLLAEGNIRDYEIFLAVVNTLNLPLSYFALRAGFPPESVFVIAIAVGLAVMGGRIWLARRAFGLSSRKFARDVLARAALVAAVAGAFAYFLKIPCGNAIAEFLAHSALIAAVTGTVVALFGLNSEERKFLRGKLISILRRKHT